MTNTTDNQPPIDQEKARRPGMGGGVRTLLVATFIFSVAALGLSGAALIMALKLQREGAAQSVDFAGQARVYIESHPEVIIDSMNRADARQKEAETKEATSQLAAKRDEIFTDSAAPVSGNATGDATLVEFFDYNCPYCRKAAPVMDQLTQVDPGVKIVFKEFPILGAGSTFAARAALASQKQGKYLPFHDALLAFHGPITEASTMDVAKNVGLDLDRLKTDMADPTIDAALKNNIALAETLRISGTPTFVSRKAITPGLVDLDTLKQMVADARKE